MRCAVFLQIFIVTFSTFGISCLADYVLDGASDASVQTLNFLPLEGRVVNGTIANPGQFPHQVSLRRSYTDEHFCGGSIISNEWILTASHCMFKNGRKLWPWMVTVVAGQKFLQTSEPSSQRREVEAIILHDMFDYWTLTNDVALLKLKSPLTLIGSRVKAIEMQPEAVPPGTICQVSGWGATKENSSASNDLMYVDLPIIKHSRCKELLVNVTRLPPGMICAGYEEGLRDACQGDSGGPMMCSNFLSGIVSGGQGCARSKLPGLYTNVSYYRSWVEDHMNNYTTSNDQSAYWATKILKELFSSNTSHDLSPNQFFQLIIMGYTILGYLGLSFYRGV